MTLIDIEEIRGWAVAAGEIARGYFTHTASWRKADRSLVTEADGAIERQLVEQISRRYPSHGILGEEQTRHALSHEFVWAVDPLDGTASFVAGLPTWGVSIGLLRDRQPYLGVIYLPLLGDCYWAGPEGAAYRNDEPIQVRAPEQWDGEEWLSIPANAHRRYSIDFSGKTRVLGSTAASMCYVARGSALGALMNTFALWDVAAGLAIVRAAGGVVAGLDGAQFEPSSLLDGQIYTSSLLVAAAPQLTQLQAIISKKK